MVVLAIGLLIAGFATRAVLARDPAPAQIVNVDLRSPVAAAAADPVGFGQTTYGATPLTSTAVARAERALAGDLVRIPVAVRNGVLTSGAAGGHPTDVRALVARYRSWGYRVLVVLAGRTTDTDIEPGDTTQVVSALGYDNGVEYSAPNEPPAQGMSLDQDIAVSRMIVAEGRALHPGFRLWGPVWPYYDRGVLRSYAVAMGSSLAGIDFHSYAMGERPVSTTGALEAARMLGRQVAATRADLAGLHLATAVRVDEMNLSWRYDDGTPGGERRLLSAVDTVWLAAACGYVMRAGGGCVQYGSQNGALGLTVQAGATNPDQRAADSPMPAYWGLAAWTGAGAFPGSTGRFYATGSGAGADANLDMFATQNSAGGVNVVLVNSGRDRSLDLRLRGARAGNYTTSTTRADAPYARPVRSSVHGYGDSVRLRSSAMTVTTVVLVPARSGTEG